MIEGKSRTETIEKAISKEKEELINKLGYNPADLTTVGNHSLLYIHMRNASDYETVLRTLDNFEKNNPELEITNWHAKEYSNGYIYHLFIDHRKKV